MPNVVQPLKSGESIIASSRHEVLIFYPKYYRVGFWISSVAIKDALPQSQNNPDIHFLEIRQDSDKSGQGRVLTEKFFTFQLPVLELFKLLFCHL